MKDYYISLPSKLLIGAFAVGATAGIVGAAIDPTDGGTRKKCEVQGCRWAAKKGESKCRVHRKG